MELTPDNEILVERRFARKRQAFLVDHDVSERPALVLQALPLGADIEVDVGDSSIKVALAQGGSDGAAHWWDGLRSSASNLRGTVDGLACTSGTSPSLWASELHTDGHLIAGIWDLDQAGGAECPRITWDYAEFFDDFGRLAAGLVAKLAKDANAGEWLATAVIVRADSVHYGSYANRRSDRLRPPLKRANLEFRIRQCRGPQGLKMVMELMRRDFQRAYGEVPGTW